MQTRIQREALLQSHRIGSTRRVGGEDQFPAMDRYDTGEDDEPVPTQVIVAKSLLSGIGNARPQPIRVGDRSRVDHVDRRGVGDVERSQHVRHGIERPEPLVHRDFKHGRCGVEAALHRLHPLAVPASAKPESGCG